MCGRRPWVRAMMLAFRPCLDGSGARSLQANLIRADINDARADGLPQPPSRLGVVRKAFGTPHGVSLLTMVSKTSPIY